VAVPLWIHL
jgi:hypothetical protein